MRLRLHQLILPIDHAPEDVRRAAAQRLACTEAHIHALEIRRRSLDARDLRQAPVFVYQVDADLHPAVAGSLPRGAEILAETDPDTRDSFAGPFAPATVAVLGAGPAGLLAALTLARAGVATVLFERGAPADERQQCVNTFWERGVLDAETNVLFGEGGAGLFSDGKLTSRSKDRERLRDFLDTLVRCGASEAVRWEAEPHLGSDCLLAIVPALRHEILAAGGEMRFHARLEGLHVEAGQLRGLRVSGRDVTVDACVLATGASARDTYALLRDAGVALEAKPFALGVRLEIPQAQVDRAQWGRWAGHPRLGAASFRLTRRPEAKAHACYSFCMCPGGAVIPCASAAGEVLTNGMSLSQRAGAFGNAAFLVPVEPAAFPTTPTAPAWGGIELQRMLEEAAFIAGGRDYSLPACRLADFLARRESDGLPDERSCPRARAADLHAILPPSVGQTLAHAIPRMLRALRGVQADETLLYGVETRPSSPLRILRDADGQSTTVRGLFPVGEGAGHAGGIVSSALDGMRAAEQVLRALRLQ